jgi:hypothetical protein
MERKTKDEANERIVSPHNTVDYHGSRFIVRDANLAGKKVRVVGYSKLRDQITIEFKGKLRTATFQQLNFN